jgi:hypothetical protein
MPNQEPEAPKPEWAQQIEQKTGQDDRSQPWKTWLGDKVDTGFEDEEKDDIILALKNNVQHNNVAA